MVSRTLVSPMLCLTNMLTDQIRARRKQLNRTLETLATFIGMQRTYLSVILSAKSKKDIRSSTLEALAAGLDAQWVLIPKHLMPEVERLLSGKQIGPGQVPSSVQRLLGDKFGTTP